MKQWLALCYPDFLKNFLVSLFTGHTCLMGLCSVNLLTFINLQHIFFPDLHFTDNNMAG